MASKSEPLAEGRVILHPGDCRRILKRMAENTFDACISDPPYHLQSIQKRFAKTGRADKTRTTAGPFQRHARGFMNTQWDGGSVAFEPETWSRVLRALKPGAFLLAFGGTRSYHRMAYAIDTAGFEIRDCIQWLYTQGLPKSLDVAREFEKKLCRVSKNSDGKSEWFYKSDGAAMQDDPPYRSEDANEWSGYGTALKPACEMICVARKPLSEKNVVDNVKRWGVGAIDIDACRVEVGEDNKDVGRLITRQVRSEAALFGMNKTAPSHGVVVVRPDGLWPANVMTDGSAEVRAVLGGAARCFFESKANAHDRVGSGHPTIKPVDLLQSLIRLVCPKGGLLLDPFGGTGTLGEAAIREGRRAELIERDPAYCEDIRRRMRLTFSGPEERARESIKFKTAGKPIDPGPLFGGS